MPSGAALDTAKNQLVASGVAMIAPAPSSAALQFLGRSCTDDCCQGGSPAATYCGAHTNCASFMSMKIPDDHMMAANCMNNQYMFDRMINSSATGTAPLNALPNTVFSTFAQSCKSMMTMDLPCSLGSLAFGWQSAAGCEAAAIVASSEIMTSQTSLASNVVFCPAHGSDMGGCEADNKTPTATAFANAQAAIMASNCALGTKIMAALTATEKAVMDKDSDNILDACSTTTTTTTTAAKKKDSSAASLTVSLTALASAALATVF